MVEWYDIRRKQPRPQELVLVRAFDGSPVYFEDCVNGEGIWSKAADRKVTHWCHLPPTKCPMCGKEEHG